MVTLLQRFSDYRELFGNAGIGLALRAGLATGPVEVNARPLRLKHPIQIRLKTSDIPTLQKVWRDEEYQIDPTPKPRFIIDAGANIGIASIYFAEKFPEARIVAIEPEPRNFALLEKNARPWPNIFPLRAALWNRERKIDLCDPGQGPWSFQTRENGSGRVGAVEAVTVDTLMRQHNSGTIDILKLDIEGAEKEVFESAAGWINKVNVILVELHDRLRPGCGRAFWRSVGEFPHEEHRGETVVVARNAVAQR